MKPLESIRRAAGWLSERFEEGVEMATRPESVTVTKPTYIEAIDVSAAQRPELFDVAKLKAAGISRVIVKSSEGVDYEDPRFAKHCAWARTGGFDLWSYHFLRFRHGRPQDGAEQAEQAVALAIREGCTRVALDCEAGPQTAAYAEHNAATPFEVASAIWEALDVVAVHGKAPVLYCGPSWWATHAEANPAFASALLWLADYRATPTVPAPWSFLSSPQPFGWQYGVLPVSGYPVPLDRSRFVV